VGIHQVAKAIDNLTFIWTAFEEMLEMNWL